MTSQTCAAAHAGPCDSARQLHHLVTQARIRRAWRSLMAAKRRGGPKPWSITKALADPRNKVWTCWRHHKPIEEGRIEIELPEGFWAFVAEYGLEGSVPRHLQAQVPEAA